jgi:hypothetical protein
MMDLLKRIEHKALDKMKIIYDNDSAILDFLCDLNSRHSIRDLQQFIDDSKGNPGCLLINCKNDWMVVLVLYKSPFGFSEGDNTLIMYADNDLQGLIKYFKNQLGHTSPETGKIYNALDDITRLLYWEWVKLEEENTSCNHVG